MSNKNPIVFRSAIDWLDFVYIHSSQIGQMCHNLVKNSDEFYLDIPFKILLSDDESKRSIFWIMDLIGNRLISIYINKSGKGIPSHVEFTWSMFVFYPEYVDIFLDLFSAHNSRVRRFDYNFDLHLSAPLINSRFYQDKTDDQPSIFWFWEKSSWMKIRFWDRREIWVYDKKKQILDDKLYKKNGFDWLSPYRKWLESPEYITRIEYRMLPRWCRELKDSSVSHILKYAQSYAVKEITKYYDLDFLSPDSKLPRGFRDEKTLRSIEDIRSHSRTFIIAYFNSLRDVSTQKQAFDDILRIIPWFRDYVNDKAFHSAFPEVNPRRYL